MSKSPAELTSVAARRHAILGARTRRLARPRAEADTIVSIACLVCEAGGSLYGVPLARVQAVAAFGRASPTPARNPALLGALSRSGVFFHVFDLSRLMGGGAGGAREGGHVMMLRGGPPEIALRVDEAVRVADLVEMGPEATSQMRATHPSVTAFARPLEPGLFEGRLVALLDVDQLTSGAQPGRVEGELSVDQ